MKIKVLVVMFLALVMMGANFSNAADTKGSALPAATAADGSLLYVVTDPTGTPASEVISFTNYWTYIYSKITATLGASYDTSAELDALFAAQIPDVLLDAQTVLIAVADDTPAALSVGEQKVVGRATGGDVTTLDIDSDLSAVSANDDTVPSAKATKTALDAKESSTSNDIDPDRTNNDSDDDDKLDGDLVDPPANQTQTIADSGDGNPAAGTITFTADLMFGHKDVTCSDADGCTATMGETSAVDGQVLVITNVSANTLTFSDSSGVQELASTIALGQYETLTLLYNVDRWVQKSVASNAFPFSSFATTEVDRIPITAFTDGATPPTAAAVVSSADGAFNCRAFSGTVDQDSFFTWKAPADIDATQGIKFSVSGVVGSATAPANTEVIAFSLAGVSIGNSDAAGSVGTAQTSSLTADATYAQYDSLDTAYSSAITVTNLSAGETVSFELIRLATTTDTYAQDFHPHTILIKYVRLHNATF